MTQGPPPQPLIYWSAGEASGDHHGAEVIRHLKAIAPQYSHTGLGGDSMAAQGMDLRINMARDFAIIGFTRALIAYPKLRTILNNTVAEWKTNRPAALVCVDYPGFNLPLARKAHDLGIPVFWYISPQVWAWRAGRVEIMKRVLRRTFVILPFEEQFLRDRGLQADFVGNPLLDELPPTLAPDSTARNTLGYITEDIVVGLLPGSRTREIIRHMPLLLDTARALVAKDPRLKFVLPLAPTVDPDLIHQQLQTAPDLPILATTDIHAARLSMNLALCKSGTSTLELAIAGVPMIVFYITSWLNAKLISNFLKIRDIGLVNLVAGSRICPEFVQELAVAPQLAAALIQLLPGTPDHTAQLSQLQMVREKLGGPGASQRVAHAIATDLKTIINP